MNISIVYKWGNDPDDASVSADGSFKWYSDKLVASDDDAAAVVCARQLAQDTGGQVTGVTIGNGDASWVLARGAGQTVSVEGYTLSLDEAQTAARLANAITSAGQADVVVMGDTQAFAGVAGSVAARLGLPLVAGVADFATDPDNSSCLIAHRTTNEGTETLRIHTPALVTVAAVNSESNVPSMKQLLAARKLPTAKHDADKLGVIEESKMSVAGRHIPTSRQVRLLEGKMSQAVDDLVAALRSDGILN